MIVNVGQVLLFNSVKFGLNKSFAVHRDEQVQPLHLVPLASRSCHKQVVAHQLELPGAGVDDLRVDLFLKKVCGREDAGPGEVGHVGGRRFESLDVQLGLVGQVPQEEGFDVVLDGGEGFAKVLKLVN